VARGFEQELRRLETIDPGDLGVPGALHLGAPATPAITPLERGAARLLEPGIGPVAALAAARERIAADAASVDAWAYVAGESADLEAAAAEAESPRGALHGVPVGVKDVLDVAGLPTSGGSPYYATDRALRPIVDSGAVALLRAAGAVVVGKTRTHEFAFGGTTPPTRNPRDLDRIPGGSSGGSAAAVAAGHVRVALGSDTAGSVRIPASYCGVAGLVPSPGLVPSTGLLPLAWSLDRAGLLATGPADLAAAALALGLVEGIDPAAELAGLRIGVARGTFEGAVDSAVVEAVQSALARAEQGGATLVEVDVPHQWAAVLTGLTIVLGEGADVQRDRIADRPDLIGADVRDQVALAERIGAASYVRAQRVRELLTRELLAALAQVDLLATPTMPCTAPTVGEANTGTLEIAGQEVGLADAHLRYNIGANLAALPAGTQPLPRPDGALPIGLEWVAAPGGDRRILEAMIAMENAWC
jgi:aspartyl-tRNA(Asn)/glutamyl-tRNA(Gln) amidotransferase subunit A